MPFQIDYEHEPGRLVRGRTVLPGGDQPLPWVLIVHGFKGFMDWGFFPELARRLAGRGVATVAFNTSGSGIGADLETFSEERAFESDTLSRQLEDLDRVRSRALSGALGRLDPARAGLFGHSRGGGIAILHAAEHGDYRALATWAAVSTFDRYDEATLDLWRREGRLRVHNARTGQDLYVGVQALDDLLQNRERLDIAAACARLPTPALFVHGEQDESVPVSSLDALLAACAVARALRVPGAGHTLGARHPLAAIPPELHRVLETTSDWFERHLSGPYAGTSAEPPSERGRSPSPRG
ncbi:MAG TPA: alpha/beta hydrolase [Planctomycetota bacterium]|nr:alpha/beta hydrolase [Planctomycetota bacterium]